MPLHAGHVHCRSPCFFTLILSSVIPAGGVNIFLLLGGAGRSGFYVLTNSNIKLSVSEEHGESHPISLASHNTNYSRHAE